MQKREGGKNRECDGLAGHREVQHRKTSPERRTWTAHLPPAGKASHVAADAGRGEMKRSPLLLLFSQENKKQGLG